MAELTSEGYLDLSDAEKDSEISQFEAGLAGIASGLIKELFYLCCTVCI